MTKIETARGSIEVCPSKHFVLARLQKLLTYGVLPLEKPSDGADYGIVVKCGEKEVYCLKQQPLETERREAEGLFQKQYLMVIETYCKYIKIGFKGAYFAVPYIRQRDNGLWEAGLSHCIFPDINEITYLDAPFATAFDDELGKGATNMFLAFVDCYKQVHVEANLTFPRYLGTDIRPYSHLQCTAMDFMVLGNDIYCLRSNLRGSGELSKIAWTFFANKGIEKVYHFPSIPIKMADSGLYSSKGVIQF